MPIRSDTPIPDDIAESVLRAAMAMIDSDAVSAAQALADAAQDIQDLPAPSRRQLRDDRLYRNLPDDPDDRWYRSAVVVALAYQIGLAARDGIESGARREQAALL